ncbi:FHA domain-containing protein [Saccharothrix xinjiangensis]|uniref:FHA domain-containing protein n=1 Tax=Saccharothrix xinjiangensis TaxID=204798 RepID=A0ABV9Y2W5_9PSEU
MKSRVTCFRVTSPDGYRSTHELGPGRTRIGRATLDGAPELVLDPDPHRLVSRVHCIVEHADGVWTVTDNGSDNGTVLRRGGELTRVLGMTGLRHGDALLVIGDITPAGDPRYWKLTFDDPFRTEVAPVAPPPATDDARAHLTYDWLQMKVFRVEGGARSEITGLSPQSHRLIRYLAELSRVNNGSPVACTHAELIHMLWGRPEEWPPSRSYDETNLRNVVTAVRKRIERDPANPVLLQTERNIGYRLLIRVDPAAGR